MGVRFACHACGKPLHVKAELSGKRGICPECKARFRIPAQDSEFSIRLDGEASDRTARGSSDPVNADPANADPANADPVDADPVDADPVDAKRDGGVPPKTEPEPHRDRAAGLLESEPESVWYVRPPSGGQYGPATSELLKQWIEEQRVASTALLWREGWPQWRAASEALPEWADQLPTPLDGKDDEAAADDGSVTDAVTGRSVTSPDTESEIRSGVPGESHVQGRWDVGAARRGRLTRRTLAVGGAACGQPRVDLRFVAGRLRTVNVRNR